MEEREIEEPVTLHQVDWMDCAQQLPKTKNLMHQKLNELANKNYNWNNIRKKYTKTELDSMSGWLLNKKAEQEINNILETENVEPENLNKYQRFAFNMVKDFEEKKTQLLLILLGNI